MGPIVCFYSGANFSRSCVWSCFTAAELLQSHPPPSGDRTPGHAMCEPPAAALLGGNLSVSDLLGN